MCLRIVYINIYIVEGSDHHFVCLLLMFGFSVLGEDYDAADPLTVTFPCGLISTIGNITILDDAVLEEIMTSFNVTVISSDVNGFPLGPEAAVTIIDNEGGKTQYTGTRVPVATVVV